MSSFYNIVHINPGKYGNTKEEKDIKGFKCPSCNGQGHFIPEQVGHDRWVSIACDRCNGTGRLAAKVTVEWYPEFRIKLNESC